MADEWWSTSAVRTGDDGASACSTVPATDESAAATCATSTDYFRPNRLLHVSATAVASPPPSFLADPPDMVDWTQAYIMHTDRSPPFVRVVHGDLHDRAATGGFNDLLQQHPYAVDGTAPVAPPPAAASLYADIQYSSYGGVPAAPMTTTTKPFSQQHFPAGVFGSSARNFGGVPSVPLPMTTAAKPLLLQALEQKAFKFHNEHIHQDACSSTTKNGVSDSPPAAPNKKPRIATPSPMPTFKVRKEKLGDRITALQQLVSPFGKTDTASVLHEAIECIRFLHDQVASLSSPYLRCGRGRPLQMQQLQQQQAKDGTEAKEDLRSRGLCLVPVASTYAVASETAPEFWQPTFGGTFR
ncbi:unnamed protein product [Urochloa humidicola]